MEINYLAIIPARSGSKGIPNKNITKIKGKECFRYTLEPIINSKIDKIFFTTDSIEYLELYKKYTDTNKDVTFDYLRSNKSSSDTSIPDDYINECLYYLDSKGYIIKNFIILQPTSLFRTSKEIDDIIDFHKKNNCMNIKSVSPVIQTPYHMIYENNEKVIDNNFKNRQEHLDVFIFNGAYYVYSLDKYKMNSTNLFIKYIMKDYHGFDLDNETDLNIIGLLL